MREAGEDVLRKALPSLHCHRTNLSATEVPETLQIKLLPFGYIS